MVDCNSSGHYPESRQHPPLTARDLNHVISWRQRGERELGGKPPRPVGIVPHGGGDGDGERLPGAIEKTSGAGGAGGCGNLQPDRLAPPESQVGCRHFLVRGGGPAADEQRAGRARRLRNREAQHLARRNGRGTSARPHAQDVVARGKRLRRGERDAKRAYTSRRRHAAGCHRDVGGRRQRGGGVEAFAPLRTEIGDAEFQCKEGNVPPRSATPPISPTTQSAADVESAGFQPAAICTRSGTSRP